MNKHMLVTAPVLGGCDVPVPLVLGHFLPWYILDPEAFPLDRDHPGHPGWLPEPERMRHWHDARAGYRRTHLHMPQGGIYDSRDPAVVYRQIEQAQAGGLGGFIINWYGKHSVENLITLHVLDAISTWNRQHPDRVFLYCLSLDSQARRDGEGRRAVSFDDDLHYVRTNLMTDAYVHVDGRPVFPVFPYENDCGHWVAALDRVFGERRADLLWMQHTPGEGEAGAYPWVRPDERACDPAKLYGWSDPDNTGTGFLRMFYDRCNETGHGRYLMGGVWPGFDDQLVSWAWQAKGDEAHVRPRVICRESTEGNTLEMTCGVLLDYYRRQANGDPAAALPIPLVQVVTWNDYAEASTVEPTQDYGTSELARLDAFRREAVRLLSGVQ